MPTTCPCASGLANLPHLHTRSTACCHGPCVLPCRYGARFVTEYVDATTGADSLNVGEYWVDLQVG